MQKARLAWVMSGLSQHQLTKTEEAFLEGVSEEFDKNQALTEAQEKRIEALYKEKSQLTPDKYPPTPKESPKRLRLG